MLLTAVLSLVIAVMGVTLSTGASARADTVQEIWGCEKTTDPQVWATGGYRTVNGVEYAIYRTPSEQVGPAWSACEDINFHPYAGLWPNFVYARTYMCSSSSSCWYNAWRYVGLGGGQTATDMVNGTWYYIEYYSDVAVQHIQVAD